MNKMIQLNDPIWKTFEGGYRNIYDASVRLKELEKTNNEEKIAEIFGEFWEELHHQGDVGFASYFALPHLIRIGIEQKLDNWDIPAFVAVIEIQRHHNNPKIPEEFIEDYKKEIQQITNLIAINQDRKWDKNYSVSALSAIAAVNGQIDLAKIILELDDEDCIKKINSFLKGKE